MNLYLISRPDEPDWGDYRNAVVAAGNEDEARLIHRYCPSFACKRL